MGKIIVSANTRFLFSASSETTQWAEEKFHEGVQKYPPAFREKNCNKDLLDKIEAWAQKQHADGISDMIVIGMGGSSLGAKALESVIRHEQIGREKTFLHFWEGSHPTAIAQVLHQLENRKVAALFVSKSGTTLESRTMLALFRQFFPESRVTFVTSHPEKIKDIQNEGEETFLIPENLGGRYSVISPVGLLPAAFLNGNIRTLVGHYYQAIDKLEAEIPFAENPAKKMALSYYKLFTSGFHTNVLWSYSREFHPFMDWIVQLWAESLGKNELVRALPVPAKGPEDQHSVLQYYMSCANEFIHTFFHVDTYGAYSIPVPEYPVISSGKSLWRILHSQMKSIEMALDKKDRPVIEFIASAPNIESLGKQMAFWMWLVTYLAALYGVNPYDQPGVELGKVICKEILSEDKIPENLSAAFEL